MPTAASRPESIFDASALIHLINGDLLDVVLSLPGKSWFVGYLVLDECRQHGVIPLTLQQAIADKKILLLDDAKISSTTYLTLLKTYNLGEGETECLTFGISGDYIICCDDLKARRMIEKELGADRVTGSLGLLKEAVHEGLLSANDAYEGYKRMLDSGAFLPLVVRDYFL